MIHTRLGTPVTIVGGETYPSGNTWLVCQYEDCSTCPIHISDLDAHPAQIMDMLHRVRAENEIRRKHNMHDLFPLSPPDGWLLDTYPDGYDVMGFGEALYDEQQNDSAPKHPTIHDITECNWVVMSPTQTPKLVKELVINKLPRREKDAWWMHVGDFTPDKATSIINAQWDLCDDGFVFDQDGNLQWKWW